MQTSGVDCKHRKESICEHASKMAEVCVSTTEKACAVCLLQKTRTNHVTASLALSQIKRPLPREKQYLLGLLKTFTPVVDGPGTELKKLIAWFYSPYRKKCRCLSRIAKMNKWGPDECWKKRRTILLWLRQSAKIAKIPYTDVAGLILLAIAVKRSRYRKSIKP